MRRYAVDSGINYIDTADAYGPETAEHPIRKALHPDRTTIGEVVATVAANADHVVSRQRKSSECQFGMTEEGGLHEGH